MYDFSASTETQLTSHVKGDDAPKFSPDGQMLAFVRDDKSVVVMDLATKQERVIASGFISPSPRNLAWSADGKWIGYLGLSTRSFRNAYLVPVAGGESRAVSAIPNANTNVLSWSPDGTFLVFNSSQRTEDTSIVRVDLTLRPPKFAEDQFRDLFRDEPGRNSGPGPAGSPAGGRTGGTGPAARPAEVKPIEIVFDDIRRRVSTLNVGTNFSAEAISPDGRWLLVNGDGNLSVYPLEPQTGGAGGGGGRGGGAGGGQTRQLTTTPGAKTNAQFTSDSREVFYLEGGRINVVNVESRQSRAVNVTAELDVDFSKEKMEVFRQAWTYMRDGFYDEKFHGADWSEVRAAVHAGRRRRAHARRAAPRAQPDDGRAQRVAPRRLRRRRRRRRPGVEQRPARPRVRSRRVRDGGPAARDPCRAARTGGDLAADQGRRVRRRRQRRARSARRRISTSS